MCNDDNHSKSSDDKSSNHSTKIQNRRAKVVTQPNEVYTAVKELCMAASSMMGGGASEGLCSKPVFEPLATLIFVLLIKCCFTKVLPLLRCDVMGFGHLEELNKRLSRPV